MTDVQVQASCSLYRPTICPKSCGWSSTLRRHWHRRFEPLDWLLWLDSCWIFRSCIRSSSRHRQQQQELPHKEYGWSCSAAQLLHYTWLQWRCSRFSLHRIGWLWCHKGRRHLSSHHQPSRRHRRLANKSHLRRLFLAYKCWKSRFGNVWQSVEYSPIWYRLDIKNSFLDSEHRLPLIYLLNWQDVIRCGQTSFDGVGLDLLNSSMCTAITVVMRL